MLTLQETKDFLRLDGDDEDALISSLIITAKGLTEEVLRRQLSEFEEIPEPVHQAMLMKNGKWRKTSRAWTSRKRSILSAECCLRIDGRRSNGYWQT